MKRKANGTPPNWAKTPDAVETIRLRMRPREVSTALATMSPSIPGMIEVITESSIVVMKPWRYTPCVAVAMLAHVQWPEGLRKASIITATAGTTRNSAV
jgi:hypothetical protein